MPTEFQKSVRHGDKVTILIPAGIGRDGQEWTKKTGTAVMYSRNGGWVLNMGGKHGYPRVATETNTVSIRRTK